ncbi:MAG: hypothetical protein GY796_20190 [Chloroflexi bacterium]|nr:hypothetical protein [Chloroflexota bacterium]
MKSVKHHVHGKLILADGAAAVTHNTLILLDPYPEKKTADSLYLRYAVVVQGPEDHIFPAFLLDDWGNENRSLDLYGWIEDEGNQYPRSEVFGFNNDGTETQCFLRALELYSRLPCYAYPEPTMPLSDGVLLRHILLPDPVVPTIHKSKRPSHLQRPLVSAKVTWWQINPGLSLDQIVIGLA